MAPQHYSVKLHECRELLSDTLHRQDINELVGLDKPPKDMEVVMSVACVLMGMTEHENEFRMCHMFLVNGFRFLEFSKRDPSFVSHSALEKCRHMMREHAEFFPCKEGTTKWVATLSKWCIEMVECAEDYHHNMNYTL